jgi:hypothetical protein
LKEKPMMIGGMHQGLPCSKAMLVSSHLALVDHQTPFALAPLEFIKNFYEATTHKMEFYQTYYRDLLKKNPRKFILHLSEFYSICRYF